MTGEGSGKRTGQLKNQQARVRNAAKNGQVPEIVFIGVVVADHMYRKGMTVTKAGFKRLKELGEVIVSDEQIEELFEPGPINSQFIDVVRERGLILAPSKDNPDGLTIRQLLALSKAADILDRRPLAKKLADVGVGWWEWQTWLANPIFSREHRRTAENALEKNQADVLNALTASAVGGDLRAIEYFNKVSGRYDPNTQNIVNVREVLSGVIEILQEVLSDQPATLAKIGAKLQLQLLQSGVGQVVEDRNAHSYELEEPA